VRSDARSLPEVPDEAFEGLVCNLALMDIPDLEATLHTVARVPGAAPTPKAFAARLIPTIAP
jgi:ubiquinone/menaquinone biosynthesis C-methylase UbiE